jgi:hypothetical protein
MPLLGNGVLAIWNGIEPNAESDFVAWHVTEHIPERVALPGFLRGRRYIAADGHPKYFNFYETERTDTLFSADYVARLNAPTPWTRRVVANFRDTSRTVCSVTASLGRGEGGWLEAIRLGGALQSGPQLLSAIICRPAIIGAHLLQGVSATATSTAESKLRDRPDETSPWILLIEAVDPENLLELRTNILSDEKLCTSGAGSVQRGVYGLQFSLAKAELKENTSPAPQP